MTDGRTITKAWALLDPLERRNAFKVLALMIVAAFASAAMVGSVFPFLAVLSDPGLISENPSLALLYSAGGFQSDYGFLVALGVAAIGIIFLSNAILMLETWVVSRYAQMRMHSISQRLLSHYLSQPYEFFLGRHSGEMSTNILSETQLLVEYYLNPVAQVISAALTAAAVLLTLLLVEPVLASITVGTVAAMYGTITLITRQYVKRMGYRRAQTNSERFRIAGEALGGIKDVKLLGREAAYLDRYSASSVEMARTRIGVGVIGQVPRFAIQFILFGGIVLICLLLLDPQGLQDREALGGFLPLIGLLAFAGQRLMPELQKLYQFTTVMTSGAAAVDRVYADYLSNCDASLDRVTPSPLGLRRELRMTDVTYSYPNADRAGLQGVSLTLGAGERIGIVGGSGAGKTTLADVVLGLLHPQAGILQADDKLITASNLRAWQQTVGYVPQDIFLTDASLAENIALGLRPEEIDLGKVERAARIAQLHDFAMSDLKDGYDTMIGERGVRLSGGQRQRIGIARALYHDADLIVFDEATSALDNITEREVMSAISSLPGEKTALIIAHRLTTVASCDRIIIMKQGQVVDVGDWDYLSNNSPDFSELMNAHRSE